MLYLISFIKSDYMKSILFSWIPKISENSRATSSRLTFTCTLTINFAATNWLVFSWCQTRSSLFLNGVLKLSVPIDI